MLLDFSGSRLHEIENIILLLLKLPSRSAIVADIESDKRFITLFSRGWTTN